MNWLRKQWALWEPAIVALTLFALWAISVRVVVSAWLEEREHAEFLFDCTHMQTPNECQNTWLTQYASKPPPFLVELSEP